MTTAPGAVMRYSGGKTFREWLRDLSSADLQALYKRECRICGTSVGHVRCGVVEPNRAGIRPCTDRERVEMAAAVLAKVRRARETLAGVREIVEGET